MKGKIKFAIRIEINSSSTHQWDKMVFDATYFEYRIQHQAFQSKDSPVKSYWELQQKTKSSRNIPFLLSLAAQPYIEQLEGELKSMTDVLGTTFFQFENFKLDLKNSHLDNPSKHQIGITFYSPTYQLLDIIDSKYLLANEESDAEHGCETWMLPFQPELSICYFEREKNQKLSFQD